MKLQLTRNCCLLATQLRRADLINNSKTSPFFLETPKQSKGETFKWGQGCPWVCA